MISVVMVLCGGLGTRMKGSFPGVPKFLLPVGNRRCADIFCDRLGKITSIEHVLLLTGHLSASIHEWAVSNQGKYDFKLEVVDDNSDGGTYGAIEYASKARLSNDSFVVVNGDTFFSEETFSLIPSYVSGRIMVPKNRYFGPSIGKFDDFVCAGIYFFAGALKEKINNDYFSAVKRPINIDEMPFNSNEYIEVHSQSAIYDVGTYDDLLVFSRSVGETRRN